jgi:hypothetical protein
LYRIEERARFLASHSFGLVLRFLGLREPAEFRCGIVLDNSILNRMVQDDDVKEEDRHTSGLTIISRREIPRHERRPYTAQRVSQNICLWAAQVGTLRSNVFRHLQCHSRTGFWAMGSSRRHGDLVRARGELRKKRTQVSGNSRQPATRIAADQFRIYTARITAAPVLPDTLRNIVPMELLPAVLILFRHRIGHTRQNHLGLSVLPRP